MKKRYILREHTNDDVPPDYPPMFKEDIARRLFRDLKLPEITLFDTGAPRGERNMWVLEVNGHAVMAMYGSRMPKIMRELKCELMAAFGLSE